MKRLPLCLALVMANAFCAAVATVPDTILYEPVEADRIVRDGDQITLGGVTLTAHLTPGHTNGATTWTMNVTDNGRSLPVVFFSSASINPGTKLVGNAQYPEIADDLSSTFGRLRALPCEVFFAPHGGQFAMADKFEKLKTAAQPNPFIDPSGWRAVIDDMERRFQKQLAAEKASAPRL